MKKPLGKYAIEIYDEEAFLVEHQIEKLTNFPHSLDVVIDVGAHVGTFSLAAADKGARKIYAVEPDRENYEMLLSNIRSNNLQEIIIPLHFAVGNECKVAEFRRAGFHGQHSLLFRADRGSGSLVSVVPFCILIEKILELEGRVDYLKMDIEGGEWDCFDSLRDREDLLGQIRALEIEIHSLTNADFFDAPEGQKEKEAELKPWLESLGFTETTWTQSIAGMVLLNNRYNGIAAQEREI